MRKEKRRKTPSFFSFFRPLFFWMKEKKGRGFGRLPSFFFPPFFFPHNCLFWAMIFGPNLVVVFVFRGFERFRILEVLNYTFVWTLRGIWVCSDGFEFNFESSLISSIFSLPILILKRFFLNFVLHAIALGFLCMLSYVYFLFHR